MKKRIVSLLLILCMTLTLLPTTILAAETEELLSEEQQPEEQETPNAGKTIYVDATNGNDENDNVGQSWVTAYRTLDKAMEAANSGDTIYLGEGIYSGNYDNPTVQGKGAEKNLTFVGVGTDKTTWHIQATQQYGSDGWCDYSFKGSDCITFENMTVISSVYSDGSIKNNNTQGLTYINHLTLKDCIFNGRADYWGYKTTTFENVTFNAPGTAASGIKSVDYSLWTWTGTSYTFKNCTFNSCGKIINAYCEKSGPVTINFENCTVNNTTPNKQVLNIKDSSTDYTVNISGINTVTNVKPNAKTCSRLFQVESVGEGKSHYATVSIDGETVWQNGKMVSHAIDTANDKYTDGYKDNAFTVTWGAWYAEQDGKLYRTGTRTCNYCGYSEDIKDEKDFELDVSRSKEATDLDSNYRSTVTLSLPSAKEKMASDIVFVLDKSSCSAETAACAEQMFDSLKTEVSKNESKIQIGVVVFGGDAKVSYPLSTFPTTDEQLTELKNALTQKPSDLMGGTNMHAGLLAAQEMLRNSSTDDKNRQYVILVSDGLPRLFTGSDGRTKDIYYQYNNSDVTGKVEVGTESGKIHPKDCYYQGMIGEWVQVRTQSTNSGNYVVPYGDWDEYFSKVEDWVEADGDKYALDYATYGNDATAKVKDTVTGDITDLNFKYIGHTDYENHAMSVDRAVYEAYNAFTGMVDSGYHCYAYLSGSTEFGRAFMGAMNSYAGNVGDINFTSIGNDILYAVGRGSTVEDKMGSEFDFIPGSLELTVGGKKLVAKTVENVTYFGDDAKDLSESKYRFKVAYDKGNDMFTWTINENVSNFAPVQLSYQVQLVNPKTAPGTYDVYTNEYAKLTPVDSLENTGTVLPFDRPVLSYTVKRHHTPTTVTKPALNTADHYAYVMGYPDGTVQPGGYITRAEASTIFFRLLTDETREQYWATTNAYSDIKSGDWYNNAISTLSSAGIVSGYPDGTFRPNAPITRAEMSKIIALFAKLDKTTDRFSDIAGHWAEAYIKLAAGNGWIEGYPDGTFKPQQNITRAETVTMINRVLERVPSDEDHLLSYSVMLTFPDCQPGQWFYIAMQEATNSHTYERAVTEKNGDEQWTALRANRDWTLLEK